MKIPDQKVGQCTNVWMQDSVFAHVEKELREMEDRLAPGRKTFTLSGELFNFIEMELKQLNSSLILESSPQVFPQTKCFSEIPRALLPRTVPSLGRGEARRRTVSTGAFDNTRETSDTRRHVRVLSEGTVTEALSTSSRYSLQSGRRNQSKNKKRGNTFFYDKVLCLKDLDQSPPPRFFNFRSTCTDERKVPQGAGLGCVMQNEAWNAQRGCKSTLALKRCAENSVDGNSFKKRKNNAKAKRRKAKKKEAAKITRQCKAKNVNIKIYTSSNINSEKCIASVSSKAAIPCVGAGDSLSIPHPAQPCIWSGGEPTQAKAPLTQSCLRSTGSFQGIPQMRYNTKSRCIAQVNQDLPPRVDNRITQTTSAQSGLGFPLQPHALQLPLEVPVPGVSRPLKLLSINHFEENSDNLKEQGVSAANRHKIEESPPHNHSVASTSTFFPFFSPAFMCICSAPRVCVLSPSPRQKLTQEAKAMVRQHDAESGRTLVEYGGITSYHRCLAFSESKTNSVVSAGEPLHELPWSSKGRPVAKNRSEWKEGNKHDSLCSFGSNCRDGGGLVGYRKKESTKNCVLQGELNRAPTFYHCQPNEKTHKTECTFPPDEPCNLIIQVPHRGIELEMNASKAPVTSLQDDPMQKYIPGGMGTISPSRHRHLMGRSVTDTGGSGEIKCEKTNRLIINTRKKNCLSVMDPLNCINKLVTCGKDKCSRHSMKTNNNADGKESCKMPLARVLEVVPASACVTADSGEDLADRRTLSGSLAHNVEPVCKFLGSDTTNIVTNMMTINSQTKQDCRHKTEETKRMLLRHEEPFQKITRIKRCGTRSLKSGEWPVLPSTSGYRSQADNSTNIPVKVRLHDLQYGLQSGQRNGSLENPAEERHWEEAYPPVDNVSLGSGIGAVLRHAPLNLNVREGKETMNHNFQNLQKLQPSEMTPSFQEVYRADVLLEENKDKGLSVYTINYQLLPSFKATCDSAILLRRNLPVAPSTSCTDPQCSATNLKTPPQCRLSKKSYTCSRKSPSSKGTKSNLRTGKLKNASPVKMQVTNVAGTTSIIYTLVDVASQVVANSEIQGKHSTGRVSALTSCRKCQSDRLNTSCNSPQAFLCVCQMSQGVDDIIDANVTHAMKPLNQTNKTRNKESWHSSVNLNQDHLQPLQKTKKRKSIDESDVTSPPRKDLINLKEWYHPNPMCSANCDNSHSTPRKPIPPQEPEGATQTCFKSQGEERGEDILRQAMTDLFDILPIEENSGCVWPLDEDSSVGHWKGKLSEREPMRTPKHISKFEIYSDVVPGCVSSKDSSAALTSENTSVTTPLMSDNNGAANEDTSLKLEDDLQDDSMNSDDARTDMTESDDEELDAEDWGSQYSFGGAHDGWVSYLPSLMSSVISVLHM